MYDADQDDSNLSREPITGCEPEQEQPMQVVSLGPERILVTGHGAHMRVVHRFYGSDSHGQTLLDVIANSGGQARLFVEFKSA